MSFGMWGVPSPTDPPAPQSFYGMKHAFAKRFLPGIDGSLRTEPIEIKKTEDGYRDIILAWLEGYMTYHKEPASDDAKELYKFIHDNPQGVMIWVGDWLDGPYGKDVEPETEPLDDVKPAEARSRNLLAANEIRSQRIELEDHQMFGSGN